MQLKLNSFITKQRSANQTGMLHVNKLIFAFVIRSCHKPYFLESSQLTQPSF